MFKLKAAKAQTLALVGIALATVSTVASAQATPPDFSDLTDAVNFTTVGVAILAIAALKVTPLVVTWGARKVLGMIGR